MKAIETKYKGYRFRSRLEARWAVFFDALGLSWEFEPEGFELGDGVRYLPDFKVTYPDGPGGSSNREVWFEVKGDPSSMSQLDWDKLVRFEQKKQIFLLDGAPAARMYLYPTQWLKRANCSRFDNGIDFFEEYPTVIEGLKCLPLVRSILQPYCLEHDAVDLHRSGFALWSHKHRMWWDDHGIFFDDDGFVSGVAELKNAVSQALGARFEHGESGMARAANGR